MRNTEYRWSNLINLIIHSKNNHSHIEQLYRSLSDKSLPRKLCLSEKAVSVASSEIISTSWCNSKIYKQ